MNHNIDDFFGKKGFYTILLELQKFQKIKFTLLRKLTKLDDNTICRRLQELERLKLINRHVLRDRSVDYNITLAGKKVLVNLSKIESELMKQ